MRLVRTITASRRIKTLDCSTKMGSDGGTVNPKMEPLPVLSVSITYTADSLSLTLVSVFGDMQRR